MISKIHKNFTICVTRMRDEDQTHIYAPQPTSFPNHHTVVGETPHKPQYTLAHSNLHQLLIGFLNMIPSCKQYWKDVQTWCKVWNHIDTEFDY